MNELDRLRDRIRDLEDVLGLTFDLPNSLGLTATEKKIVGLIAKRDLSREAIYLCVYGHKPECDQPDPKVIEVHLVKIRRKLQPHGITIKNRYTVGYYLESADRAKLKELAGLKSVFSSRLQNDLSNLKPLTRHGAAA